MPKWSGQSWKRIGLVAAALGLFAKLRARSRANRNTDK